MAYTGNHFLSVRQEPQELLSKRLSAVSTIPKDTPPKTSPHADKQGSIVITPLADNQKKKRKKKSRGDQKSGNSISLSKKSNDDS